MSRDACHVCQECGFKVPAGDFVGVAIMTEHRKMHEEGMIEHYDESSCDRCGRTNPVWSTPVSIWQKVYGPGGQPTRQGVLCPSCFIDDAEAAGVTAPQGTPGWLVAPEVTVDPRRDDVSR